MDLTPEERLASGRVNFSRMVVTLLLRNGLSHAELKMLSEWASPDSPSWLSTSQISYLRTGILKSIGPKTVDALGQLNLALAHLAGDDSERSKPFAKLPRLPSRFKAMLDHPFFIRDPETKLPMHQGDLYRVWIGRLKPDESALKTLSQEEAITISKKICVKLQRWCAERQLLLTEGLPQILKAYPYRDNKKRVELFSHVAAGVAFYTPEQIEEEIDGISETLESLGGTDLNGRKLIEALYETA